MTSFNPFGGDNVKTGIEEFPEAPEFSYGVFKNGVFKKSKESIGTFVIKVADVPKLDLGLTKECEFSFERCEDIPLIPHEVFSEVLELYRGVFKTVKSEVYSMVFWDKKNEDFFIHVPPQKVSYASVKYEKDPAFFGNPDLVPVFESHSHCDFGAFFSGTDLKDEQDARYFAVFGKITQELPEFTVRVASQGQALPLEFEDVFDSTKPKMYETSNYKVDLKEALSLIEEIKVATYKTSTYKSSTVVSKKTVKTTIDPYYEDFDYYYGVTADHSNTGHYGTGLYDTVKNHLSLSQTMFEYDIKVLNKRVSYDSMAVQNLSESFLNLLKEQYEEQVDVSEILLDIQKGFARSK